MEERRLGLLEDVDAASFRTIAAVTQFLECRGLGGVEAATDLLYLSRGLIDGALDHGNVDHLEDRLAWAILGYLALSRQVETATDP